MSYQLERLMGAKPRLCIDCRWCYVPPLCPRRESRCRHPSNYMADAISLVTGEMRSKYVGSKFCNTQRIGPTECGEAGRFWGPSTGDQETQELK